jgi:acyl-CoA synthetase (AMP-forming)/AMP-acid ligase II
LQKVSLTFSPNFLISKLATDLSSPKLSHLHGTFDLSSLKRINSGGEAVVSSTVKSFLETLHAVTGGVANGDRVIEFSAGFGMTETWYAGVYGLSFSSTYLFYF